MSSQLNPKFSKNPFSKGETILSQVDAEQSTTYTPKRLKWNEMTILDQFKIKEPQFSRDIERREPSQIVEEPDVKVTIKFDRTNSFINFRNTRRYQYYEHRAYCSDIHSTSESKYTFKMPIPQPTQTTEDFVEDSYSPTRSTMVIISDGDFEPDMDYLNKELSSPFYKEKEKWFNKLDNKVKSKIKNEWVKEIKKIKSNFLFYDFVAIFLSSEGW